MPNKADNLINKAKDNAKIDRMKDALDGRLTPQSSGNMYSDIIRQGKQKEALNPALWDSWKQWQKRQHRIK